MDHPIRQICWLSYLSSNLYLFWIQTFPSIPSRTSQIDLSVSMVIFSYFFFHLHFRNFFFDLLMYTSLSCSLRRICSQVYCFSFAITAAKSNFFFIFQNTTAFYENSLFISHSSQTHFFSFLFLNPLFVYHKFRRLDGLCPY